MTGGGPGGATKLYSILAYEKAIGSLQYGPGSAIALSVAPLMVLLIWLLAKFMRHDDRSAPKRRKWFGFGGDEACAPARASAPGSSASSAACSALCSMSSSCRSICCCVALTCCLVPFGSVSPDPRRRPVLEPRRREKIGIGMRLLVLFPIMVFVLFPFYWVVVTSFKTTPQISQRASIFWPNPATLEQYRALLSDTPFLIVAAKFGGRGGGQHAGVRRLSRRWPPTRCRG